MKKFSILLLVIVLTTGTIPVSANYPHLPTLIAHAGGFADGFTGSNSLEALTASSVHGFLFVEVDIVRTSDNSFVLNHDWEFISNRVPLAPDSPVTASEFASYKIFNKLTTVSLDDLIDFLNVHKSISIITDTKNRDYGALEFISEHYNSLLPRFIPQVYSFDDFNVIKTLGFDNIIVTVYNMSYQEKTSPDWIFEQALQYEPFAVTIPEELLTTDYIKRLRTDRIRYFTHTINSLDRAMELFSLGIDGFYTDTLYIHDNTLTSFNQQTPDVEPFTDYNSNKTYYPLYIILANFGADNEAYYHNEKRYAFNYNGIRYVLNLGSDHYAAAARGFISYRRTYGFFLLYRDFVFVPDSFFLSIFS